MLGEMSKIELPDISQIGRDWVVVEAFSDSDALHQAMMYDSREHSRAYEMGSVFTKIRDAQMDPLTAMHYVIENLYSQTVAGSISIKIEDIGHTTLRYPGYKPRTWVAEIIGNHDIYRFDRVFLKPKVDYTHADRRAYRGVMFNYLLLPDKVYEISEPTSSKHTSRYYCMVINRELCKMTESEVELWLRDRSV